MTDETTAAPEPSDLMKLAQGMMASARAADDALAEFHSRLEEMLGAVHGLVQYLVAENAELKADNERLKDVEFRYESCSK